MPDKRKSKSPRPKDKGLDHKAYNYIVGASALRDIKLISTYFDVQPEFFTDREKVSLSVTRKASAFGGLDDGLATSFFEFSVKGRIEEEEVMDALAHYMTVYEVPHDAQEQELEVFCNKVGLLAAYPYFRALFAHYAGDADLGVPALPLVISSAPGQMRDDAQAEPTARGKKLVVRKKSAGGNRLSSSTKPTKARKPTQAVTE